MNRNKLWIFMIWLSLLFLISSACGSNVIPIPAIDLTATSDYATLIYLCCTAAPDISTITPAPLITNTGIVLYRGNTQRTGVYDLPAMRNQPKIKWQVKVDSTLPTSPLVVGDILYVGSASGKLYALNADTGETLWSVSGFTQLENAGTVSGDVIVSGGVGRKVKALNRFTGSELWSIDTETLIQATPLIVDSHIFIATYHAVYALDLASGALLWEVTTGDEDVYMGPPAYDDGVIYTTGGTSLLALDAETGRELWHVEKDEMFLGLAVSNGYIYIGNWNKNFYAFDQTTGEEKWKFQGENEIWFPPAVTNDTIFVGNTDSFHALNAQTGEPRWTFEPGGSFVSEPMIAEGVVYFSDANHETKRGPHHIYALDTTTGQQLWMFEITSTFLPAPALGNGVIYLTSTGEVIALE